MLPHPTRPALLLSLSVAAVLAACERPPQLPVPDGATPVTLVATAAGAGMAAHAAGADAPDAEVMRQLAAFRDGLPAVHSLPPDAPASREQLALRLVGALAAHDTAALRTLHVAAAEYAYLYFPVSVYTRPPYRQDPALRWFLMQQASEKGVGRALQRLGGRDLRYQGLHCPGGATALPGLRIWQGCTVRIDRGAGPEDVRMFGAILERDGRFKVLSYANDL